MKDCFRKILTFENFAWLLIGISVFFRFFALDRLPGINGDEVWSAVHAQEFLQGGSFQWITPTHRILNPFYALPVIFIRAIHSPSFFWLRLPAVFSGVALIPVAYFLLRRTIGASFALLATVMIACAPANIAYSRIGWELCQVGLAAIFPIYFLLRGRFWATLMSIMVGTLIHTTLVFLLPMVLFPFVIRFFKDPRLSRVVKGWVTAGVIPILILGAWLLLRSLNSSINGWTFVEGIWKNLTDWATFIEFLKGVSRLISGWSIYGDFATEPPLAWQWLDTFFLVSCFALLVFGIYAMIREKKREILLIFGGWVLMILSLYAVTGDFGVATGNERYSLFLCVPTLILGAWILATIGERWRARFLAKGMVGVTAVFFLISFWEGYFVPLANGEAMHRAYRTGAAEPKAEAFGAIMRNLSESGSTAKDSDGTTRIIAESWWLYWPMRYLGAGDPRFHFYYVDRDISPGLHSDEIIPDMETLAAFLSKGAYLVLYKEGNIKPLLEGLGSAVKLANLSTGNPEVDRLIEIYQTGSK